MSQDIIRSELVTSRRSLLRAGAAGAMATALAAPHIARAATPIRIGLLQAKEGPISLQAEYLRQGTFLALEQMGNQLLGQPAEIVWDDEPSAQGAGQNALQLIQQSNAVALLGGSLSSYALAEEAVSGQYKIPFLTNNAAAEDITGARCNPYTFRLQPPVPVQAAAMLPYLQTLGKRWYFLTASYAFGQDIAASFKKLLAGIGGTVVGDDEVPVETSDFSSYILKIREAQPDVVIGGISAGGLSNFLKQWKQFGMSGQIPFAEVAVGDTDLWAVGKENVSGTYTSLWYYKDPANSPKDQAFAAAYQAKYNRPAADKAWMGWYTARIMFESINAAGSTDPDKIVEALQAWRETDNGITVHFDKWNNQLVHRFLIVGVKKNIPDDTDFFDVLRSIPENDAAAAAAFGSQADSACHMTSL